MMGIFMSEYLRDVKKIFDAGNAYVSCRDDLAKIIEEPCLAACRALYDKNILTYWSSSNGDSPDYSFILVRYEFLGKNNKYIADKMVRDGVFSIDRVHESWNSDMNQYGHGICIGTKTNSDMRVSETSQKLFDLASKFAYQDIKYNIYTPRYLMQIFPFYRGERTEYCFPDLGVLTINDRNAYNSVRFISNGKLPGVSEMQRAARAIGWIFNPSDGLIYRDDETLRRHNEYLQYQKNISIHYEHKR